VSDSVQRALKGGAWSFQGESVQVWAHEESGLNWLFGMHWTPTLDRRSRRLFFEQLSQQGVRWYAKSGQAGELIGVSIEAASLDLPSQTHSAAVEFANQHPTGTHLLSVRHPDGRQWITGSHNGHVISQTDRWLGDDLQAEALILELQQRFNDLCIDRIELPEQPDLPLSSSLPWLGLDAKKISRLRRVPGSGKPYKSFVFGILVTLLILMWIGYHSFFKAFFQANQELEKTPVDASDELVSTLPFFEMHTPESLMGLLSRFDPVPVDPPGWQLQSIDCNIAVKQSHCEARYRRVSRQSDNSQLAQFAPPGWSIGLLGLDETLLTITIPIGTYAIQSPQGVRGMQWMIDLQRHTQQTPFIDLGQTQTIERMGHRVRVRSIAVRVPVRQKNRLADWQLPVRWSTVRLEVLPQTILDSHSGSLMLSLKGELLVTD